MYTADCVSLLSSLYESSVVDPTDIDYDKYTLSKKISEVKVLLHLQIDFTADRF